ncbi:MAG: DUF4177 domain-containing protein [Desulfobulbaceae bacterium]|nr:DUF4177 domain-containing protein [Desulfobulbaceae bacterium]
MRWSYKTVHYELKKEGLLGSAFLDESEIEMSLNEYGKAGWELVSLLETLDGLIAVFKQPLTLDSDSFYPESSDPVIKEKEPAAKKASVEPEAIDIASLNEDLIREVVLLDEDSLGEDLKEDEQLKKSEKVDIGSIRIE